MAQESSEIREQIEQTRTELAETVKALEAKADVKGRIRETVAENTAQLQHKASELGDKIRQVTPEKAKERLSTPVAFVPLAFLAGLLLGKRLGRRH
jgi:hypothetical protein